MEAAVDRIDIGALRLPAKYAGAIYNATARARQALSDVMDMAELGHVRDAATEAVQQARWAHQYWRTEESLKRHLVSAARLLEEIVREELALYAKHFRFLRDSRVTVWQPERGEVQAELHLPVAMETLTSAPDAAPLVAHYRHVAGRLARGKDAVTWMYEQVGQSTAAHVLHTFDCVKSPLNTIKTPDGCRSLSRVDRGTTFRLII